MMREYRKRSDVSKILQEVHDGVATPEWVREQHERLRWRTEGLSCRHKSTDPDDWEELLRDGTQVDDEDETQRDIRQKVVNLQGNYYQIRDQMTLTPAGFHPPRNTTFINGRPVQILVLTHEAEAMTAKMPYMSAAAAGCPVLLMWGRCARKPPECTPHTSIWWWFMDRLAFEPPPLEPSAFRHRPGRQTNMRSFV